VTKRIRDRGLQINARSKKLFNVILLQYFFHNIVRGRHASFLSRFHCATKVQVP